jgi:hypothetical protein
LLCARQKGAFYSEDVCLAAIEEEIEIGSFFAAINPFILFRVGAFPGIGTKHFLQFLYRRAIWRQIWRRPKSAQNSSASAEGLKHLYTSRTTINVQGISGCQIFPDTKYQNGEKYTKLP